MDLKDKIAIVTGAARGFGEVATENLLKRGAKVCMCDMREDLGRVTCNKFAETYGADRVLFVTCDVRKDDSFKEVFVKTREKFGGIDIMFNNAGMFNEGRWEDTIDINLKGVIRGSLLALEYMRRDKGGRGGVLVSTGSSSVFGIKEHKMLPVYTSSKCGVVGYTRCLSAHPEIQENGIRVVCFNPGPMKTDLVQKCDNVFFGGDIDALMETVRLTPKLSVEEAVEGFLKVLTDVDNNGKTLRIEHTGTEIWSEYA